MRQGNQIPLATRLERLREGRASDPAFPVHAIHAMADLPIREYLGGDADELGKLKDLLIVTEKELETMTYKDVAVRAYRIGNRKNCKWRTIGIMDVLAGVLYRYYDKRYPKKKEDV